MQANRRDLFRLDPASREGYWMPASFMEVTLTTQIPAVAVTLNFGCRGLSAKPALVALNREDAVHGRLTLFCSKPAFDMAGQVEKAVHETVASFLIYLIYEEVSSPVLVVCPVRNHDNHLLHFLS